MGLSVPLQTLVMSPSAVDGIRSGSQRVRPQEQAVDALMGCL
jgi:hypothetical protein